MLSSWRMGVKDLPAKNKMKFNVGGIEAETREGLVTEILKFMRRRRERRKVRSGLAGAEQLHWD